MKNTITLLSDFGTQDISVAITKGTLRKELPDYEIIDISHGVESFNLFQAAYLTETSYKHFPTGTYNILLIDLFYDKEPKMLLALKDGYYFFAPDNGILSLALGIDFDKVSTIFTLADNDYLSWLNAICNTINKLQNEPDFYNDQKPYSMKIKSTHIQPVITDDSIKCLVLYIDRYQNVVLNINKELFESFVKDRQVRVLSLNEEENFEVCENYNDVGRGYILARFNRLGFLELSINHGNAADLLGLKLHKGNDSAYRYVKIFRNKPLQF